MFWAKKALTACSISLLRHLRVKRTTIINISMEAGLSLHTGRLLRCISMRCCSYVTSLLVTPQCQDERASARTSQGKNCSYGASFSRHGRVLQSAVNPRSSEFVTCAGAYVHWTYQNISVGDLCFATWWESNDEGSKDEN